MGRDVECEQCGENVTGSDGPFYRDGARICEQCYAPKRNGSPRFFELLTAMGDIHERKNQDYSPGTDPFRNFRRSEKIGIPAFAGAYTRLGDKIERCDTLIANVLAGRGEDAAVVDESLWDTLLDGANYFLIVACLYEEYKHKMLQESGMAAPEDDDVDDDMTVFERVRAFQATMRDNHDLPPGPPNPPRTGFNEVG